MAVNTLAQYYPLLRGAIRRGLDLHPEAMLLLLPGMIEYVKEGGTAGIRADRRDAVRMLLNVYWQQVLGRPYDGHAMRHAMIEARVAYADTEDIPNVAEPST